MCIRDRPLAGRRRLRQLEFSQTKVRDLEALAEMPGLDDIRFEGVPVPVSYTHLRAHETVLDLVCRLLLEKKKEEKKKNTKNKKTPHKHTKSIRSNNTHTRSHQ